MEKKDELGSSYISNFRIAADGSLEKRYGYRLLFDFGSPIRALWTGKLDGIFKGYALVGNTVLRLDLDMGSYTYIDNVSTMQGDGSFFYYRSKLYLVDGADIYIVTDTQIAKPYGYVPLVGKDWDTNTIGEPYESKDLLNDRARISYVIKATENAYLKTDENIVSVDSVLVNGEKIEQNAYSISVIPKTVIVNNLRAGDKVELCYQYQRAPGFTEALLSCTKAMVFGAITNSRPFLWGGNDKSMMFNAAYVSITDLYNSQKAFEASDELYFPFGHEFTVGDGRYPISAVSKHYDRLLIFTEGGAWMADSSTCGIEEFPVMRINSAIGVTSTDAAAMVGNEPCTVGANSIYRWTSNTDELDECNAYSISDAINTLLPQDFFTDAFVFYDNAKGEILLGSPSLGSKVLVYNVAAKTWTVFEGIAADRFIDCGSDVGFTKGSRLFVFDKSCSIDMDIVCTEICATFQSNLLDFGTHGNKHLSEMSVGYTGSDISVELFLDGNDTPECVIELNERTKYGTTEKRLSARRFKLARFTLRAAGPSEQKISSLCLYTQQDK